MYTYVCVCTYAYACLQLKCVYNPPVAAALQFVWFRTEATTVKLLTYPRPPVSAFLQVAFFIPTKVPNYVAHNCSNNVPEGFLAGHRGRGSLRIACVARPQVSRPSCQCRRKTGSGGHYIPHDMKAPAQKRYRSFLLFQTQGRYAVRWGSGT